MKQFLLTSVIFLSLCSCGEDPAPKKDEPAANNADIIKTTPGPLQGGPARELTPKEKDQVVDRILKVRAQQQAAGLGKGSVKVNKAWNYTGYSYLSVNPEVAIEARLVAVDLTVSGHTVNFDFDDIEIVDGGSLISYGSDPHAVSLRLSDGQPMPAGEIAAVAPRASRWIMIYAFPKNTKDFHLFYWGQKLTLTPKTIEKEGWELPYPEQAE